MAGCKKEQSTPSGNWLIPFTQVVDGGVGQDGIPSIDNPVWATASDVTYISGHEIVIGYKNGNDIRAYPVKVLDWHEVVNDDISGDKMAITYCPLTGTALGISRVIDGSPTTFGVSGLLYNSNVITYDRATGSKWSQLRNQCVNGTHIGDTTDQTTLVEIPWYYWANMYPDSKVLAWDQGFGKNYNHYPYGSYPVDNHIYFPIAIEDNRLHVKAKVHGIVMDGEARVYELGNFPSNMNVIHDNYKGHDLVIVGSGPYIYAASYFARAEDLTPLTFTAKDSLPVVMTDNEGNHWDVWGRAVAGPRTGEHLTPTKSWMGMWFSWANFYPGCEIY